MNAALFTVLSLLNVSFHSCFVTAQEAQVLLPKPDGPLAVKLNTMELVDNTRLQPFAPAPQPVALMVSLFYPVNPYQRTTPVDYMPPGTAAWEDSFLSEAGLAAPNGTFEKLALQIAEDSSRIHPKQRGVDFPVVLFSPAEATTRLFYSVIAQTIASYGYIVVTIDAPYDVDIVEYPDGSEVTLNVTIANNATLDDIETAVAFRAQDASFVLDQLCNASVVAQLVPGANQGLNVSQVAMFGHSLGGAATAAAMLNDTRIAGGLAMDGALFGPVVELGLDRPFMFMAHTNHTRRNDSQPSDPFNSWFDTWAHLTGWKLDIEIANSLHYTFSDFPIVLQTLNIVPDEATAKALLLTYMDGARALKIVTTYVKAFLDFVLLGQSSPLLVGPVPEFPEVTFDW